LWLFSKLKYGHGGEDGCQRPHLFERSLVNALGYPRK